MRTYVGQPNRSLGATGGQAASAVKSVTSLIRATSSGGSQTEVGATAQTVSNVASQILTVAQKIPIVNVVASVVKLAADLVDSIWGLSKDKEADEKAGQWNASNTQITQQIMQVDLQIKSVTNGLLILNDALKSQGLAGITLNRSSLGSLSEEILSRAMASNDELKIALARKIAILESLINNFNQTVTDTYDAITGNTTGRKIILWSFGGLALAGSAWILYKTITKQKI